MHCSGTSLTSRIVNLLGYHIGSNDHLMVPTDFNPKGYWENQSFAKLNDAILARFGGTWDEPPSFPTGWETSPRVADLKEHALAFVQAEFGKVKAWSWKDPRTCLTLPFWQQILPPIKYVIVLRNPVDVARSLHVRDGFAFEKGLKLWLIHTRSALVHTEEKARILVHYEDLMRHAASQIQRLSRFLSGSEVAPDQTVRTAIADFIDDELSHYNTFLIDVIADSESPTLLRRFMRPRVRVHFIVVDAQRTTVWSTRNLNGFSTRSSKALLTIQAAPAVMQ